MLTYTGSVAHTGVRRLAKPPTHPTCVTRLTACGDRALSAGMAQGDIHVLPRDTGGRVEAEGAGRPRSAQATQAEAREAGRTIARAQRVGLLVHGRNGRIRERNTYTGHDP